MRIRKSLLAAALAGAMAVPGVANASITLQGITFDAGAIFETMDLFEAEAFGDGFGNDNGIIDQPGEKLVGVGIINRIRKNDPANGNPVLWASGDNDKILTVHFFDYVSENVNVIGNELYIGFTGGIINLYSQDDPSDSNYVPQSTQSAGIFNATQGDLWLSLAGSPIGTQATPSGSVFGLLSGNPVTLLSNGPLVGTEGLLLGTGNLDVIGGSAAAFFDTDTFTCTDAPGTSACNDPSTTDKRFTSSGQVAASVTSGDQWAFFGTGEAQNFAQIPEPSSLALIGLALAALGASSRRRPSV